MITAYVASEPIRSKYTCDWSEVPVAACTCGHSYGEHRAYVGARSYACSVGRPPAYERVACWCERFTSSEPQCVVQSVIYGVTVFHDQWGRELVEKPRKWYMSADFQTGLIPAKAGWKRRIQQLKLKDEE